MKSLRGWTGTSAQLDGEGDIKRGTQSPVSAALRICLLPGADAPPCSANLPPTSAPSVLLNLHTRAALQMATPTSLHSG